ncbi:3-hydroxyacyl-CoA dehydrogenase NAD-binding domain-containing protein [Larkinella insperata]|uniref:3-hydroxyacyl-CoA dehydrogenase NAD-binding domain-containing protein n=1 Tax=Larkinella insperata TaxID=332158 RepID=A0ABW3Q9A2_9BACT|nr:3-hydroxyacyl-CoA dehydrogenase NAD-binding domain-containing protein [Larkinella insperata]
MINYTKNRRVAILSWNISSAPMNVLNDDSIPAFERALQRAYDDAEVKGIIITSEKNEFIAGADLKMILRNNDKEPTEMLKVSTELNRIFRAIETAGKPVVAAINGTALGGGYEACLACHHRIALDNPKAVIGLPEVTLGLLPGGGGTQRLPRLLGMEAALPLLLEGKRVSPREALALGMVDDLAASREELLEKAFAWIDAHPDPLQPWDEHDRKTGRIVGKENGKMPGGAVQSPAGMRIFGAATAMVMEKTRGNYPAPLAILSCVYEGLQVNIDRGLVIEARYFVKVATSNVAKSLIQTMFLGLNEVNKGSSRPKTVAATEVKKLGVVGAGMMGSGIAYVAARAGVDVVLKDISLEVSQQGKAYARAVLQKAVERGKEAPEKAEATLNRIQPTADVTDLRGGDLIIEAVFESRELKAQVTQEIEPLLADQGVFASNTSTLPISGLAGASTRPANFVGMHFFSPVDKMALVEVIRGKKTADHALAVALDFVKKLRKTPIVVNDSPGFYTSRVFRTYTTEGMEMLKEGVEPVLIENAGKNAGFPVGPLAVSDEVSLELIHMIAGQGVQDGVLTGQDTAYQVAGSLVASGRLGKKAKAGFYAYPEGEAKHLWPGLQDLFPVAAVQPTVEELKKRFLYRQALEAVRCFEEGVIQTQLDADIGSILAWGFPSYTGGALSFVDFVGITNFVRETDRLADAYGERFRPTTRLREMAERGQSRFEHNY